MGGKKKKPTGVRGARDNVIDTLADSIVSDPRRPVTTPPARNPRDTTAPNYYIENDPSRPEFYTSATTPTDSDPFGDGDQTPLRMAAAQRLRDDWSEGMGHDMDNLSEFGRLCFIGQAAQVEQMLKASNDPKKLLERRESGMRFNSMLNVICGHKQLNLFPGNPPMYHLETAKILIEYGVNVHARDIAGYTALHFCTNINSSRITFKIGQVLLKHGADINARNRFGCSPLFEPIMAGNEEAVVFLLENDADVHVEENDMKLTPAKLGMNRPSISRLVSEYSTRKQRKELKENHKCAQCDAYGDQKCSACRSVRYCSAKCQKDHWKQHKARCKQVRAEKMVVPTGPDPLKMNQGNFKKYPTNASFTIKVQLSTISPESQPMLIYDQLRTFKVALYSNHSGFEQMVKKIQAEGVLGVKAYFKASFDQDLNLIIDSGVVQVPKDW